MILEQKYLLSLFYHRYIVTYAPHCRKKKSICEMQNRNPDFSRDVTQWDVWFVKQKINLLDCLESFSMGGDATSLENRLLHRPSDRHLVGKKSVKDAINRQFEILSVIWPIGPRHDLSISLNGNDNSYD